MTQKRNYNYRSFMKSAYQIMSRALDKGLKMNQISAQLRDLVNSFSGINRNERYALYRVCWELCRSCRHDEDWKVRFGRRYSYDTVLKVARKVDRYKRLKEKRIQTRELLKDSDYIFFLCSEHQKPREEHKDYQGKIYVDRYWRTKVHGLEYYWVASYIKNHQTITMQEIMWEPVYLCNTPNCRHFFIPLPTAEVLHTSSTLIAKRRRLKEYSTDDYYRLREKIFSDLNDDYPSHPFSKMVKLSRKKIG